MSTVLITGGTGTIGARLTELLIARGYEVIILSRGPASMNSANKMQAKGISYYSWNIKLQTIDKEAIAKADHIIHLAGAGVADKRWSKKRKQEIIDSRILSSALIIKALREIPNQIKTVVSASAIGWYGKDTEFSKEHGFFENTPPDTAFLGEACRLWEISIQPVGEMDKRLVILRTGIVLSDTGGALPEFKQPLKVGVAAILGSGQQIISWIHIDDLCRMYIEAIENNLMEGVYNAVAPNPVTNQQLTLVLARQIRGRFFIAVHVPSFFLTIILGELSIEILKSATVNSRKIQNTGFQFLYTTVEKAIEQLIGN